MAPSPSVNDTPPSAPAQAAASVVDNKKPKRPLSGYNLFYRYKRCKIVEALARGDGPSGPSEEREIIESVLASPPGLEGLPPGHPVRSSPQAAVDEFRGRIIRAAMEGKLFPNENARKRLHRKSVGMGFVEMGRAMRTLWGDADRVSREVFCELADVGRARYRVLLAEYERRQMAPAIANQVKSSMTMTEDAAAANAVVEAASAAHAGAATATLAAAEILRGFFPRPSPVVSGANANPDSQSGSDQSGSEQIASEGVDRQRDPSGDGLPDSPGPLSVCTEPAPRAYSRRVSTDCQGCDADGPSVPFFGKNLEGLSSADGPGPLNPLAVRAEMASRTYSRRVSCEQLVDGGPTPQPSSELPSAERDFRDRLLRIQRMMLQQQAMVGYLTNSSDVDAPLDAKEDIPGGIAGLDARSPSGNEAADPSAQDFLDLIGTIGEAIDERRSDGEPADDGDPLCIFGMPIHDVASPEDIDTPCVGVAPPGIFKKNAPKANGTIGGLGPAPLGFFGPLSLSRGPTTTVARVA